MINWISTTNTIINMNNVVAITRESCDLIVRTTSNYSVTLRNESEEEAIKLLKRLKSHYVSI